MENTVHEIQTTSTTNFVLLAVILLMMFAFVVMICLIGGAIAAKTDKAGSLSDAIVLERMTSAYPVNAYNLSKQSKTLVLDLDGLRKGYTGDTMYPDYLDGIDSSNTNTAVTPENLTEFNRFLNALQNGLGFVLNKQFNENPTANTRSLLREVPSAPWRSKQTIQVLTIVEKWLGEINDDYIKKHYKDEKYKWQTQVTRTLAICAMYLLTREPVLYAHVSTNVIPKLLTNVELMFRGDDAQAITLPVSTNVLTPWMLSKLFTSTEYLEIVTDAAYNSVLRKLEMPIGLSMKTNDANRRYDQSYVYYRAPRVDMMAIAMSTFAQQHFLNDLIIRSHKLQLPTMYYTNLRRVVQHPKFGFRTPGMYGLQKNLALTSHFSDSPLGIAVLPTISYLRYFTDKYAFAVRAPKSGDAKYLRYIMNRSGGDDADAYNKEIDTYASLYWDHFRGVLPMSRFTPKPAHTKFSINEYGFVFPYTATTLVADKDITIDESNQDDGKTMEILWADTNEKSFVLHAKEFGVFWYDHKAISSPTTLVNELIVVNSDKETIVHTIRITVPSSESRRRRLRRGIALMPMEEGDETTNEDAEGGGSGGGGGDDDAPTTTPNDDDDDEPTGNDDSSGGNTEPGPSQPDGTMAFSGVKMSSTLEQYRRNLQKYPIAPGETKKFVTTFDLAANKVETNTLENTDDFNWPIQLSETLSVDYNKTTNVARIRMHDNANDTDTNLVASHVDLPEYPHRSITIRPPKENNPSTGPGTTEVLTINPQESYQYSINP